MNPTQGPPAPDVVQEITRPDEIRRLLRRLSERHALITAHIPGGAQVLLTAVLDITPDGTQMILDSSANEDINRRVLRYAELRCVGQVDSIGVRFNVSALRPHEHEGMSAFLADVPASLLHLQRRQYYRLRVPVNMEANCHVPLEPGPEDPVGALPSYMPLRVIDVSAGGVALRIPDEVRHGFSAGHRYVGCRLSLESMEPMQVGIRIRHLFERRYEQGAGIWQAGCEFIEPGNVLQGKIQRFIMRVDRELIARSRGIG